ncbi:MAG: coenzyme F420-0:L-glutamate ligase [Thaumarchaeota archaeon]|nr:coenzyme F420-0:L-glutamate ligase [Nitrososphaerota archaeon]
MKGGELRLFGVKGLPEISKGMDIAPAILGALKKQGETLQDGDVVVVTQKIVSKAEGRVRPLSSYKPSKLAKALASSLEKDPRHVEAILQESKRILRAERGVIIAETKHGFVCANAGIDHSNIDQGMISLLPKNPDASARRIREGIRKAGVDVAVIITDTFGRPFREGHVNFAIGIAGISPMLDYRGRDDGYGNTLKVTTVAIADEIASSAELVMGKLDRIPVAVVRGYKYAKRDGRARELVRPSSMNLFR